jgi:hypothetical protein
MDNHGNGDTIVLHRHSSRHPDQSLPARKESEIVGSARPLERTLSGSRKPLYLEDVCLEIRTVGVDLAPASESIHGC